MSTSAQQRLEDFETIRIASAEEVCAKSVTCSDLEIFFPFDGEIEQKPKLKVDRRAEVDLEFDVYSGTYQISQDTEIVAFVDSPFDELDERLPDEGKINRSLVTFRKNKRISFAQRLADRLRDLYESVIEDPDEEPLVPDSLINFIYFLYETPGLKYPDVTLTPTNEVRAQWTTAPNRHFAVSFSSLGEARFVIFKPNSDNPDLIDRFSGITAVKTLIENTKPYRVLEWASE